MQKIIKPVSGFLALLLALVSLAAGIYLFTTIREGEVPNPFVIVGGILLVLVLQRQQATAIVAARYKIVEGAVGMVEQALEMLSRKEIVTLDEDKKAAMVSNLMVVLCGERGATPVLNTGTLYQG